MQRKFKQLLFIVPAVMLILFSSCSKQDKETKVSTKESQTEDHGKEAPGSAGQKEIGSEGELNYGEGRRIYRIDRNDLNGDKRDELIVLSISTLNDDERNAVQKFDMIEIFANDSLKGKFVKKLSDTVDFAVEAQYTDLEGTGSREVLVFTNSGGNSSVASEGLFIYSMDSAANIGLVKYFDSGAPKLVKAGKGNSYQIVVTDLFHGVMPMAQAVSYTGEIYEYETDKLVLSNERYPEYYDQKIRELTEKYKAVKRKVEMGMQAVDMSYPLYREAAEVIVNYRAKGDLGGLRKFWEEERESLKRNIPEDEFADLSNFVGKILPQVNNA
ncbi:MAG: hypothetical protein K1X85_02330 [Ignavibacteria bacterium]|nr:hypothetical protein [Ignavibacteria bacterium]